MNNGLRHRIIFQGFFRAKINEMYIIVSFFFRVMISILRMNLILQSHPQTPSKCLSKCIQNFDLHFTQYLQHQLPWTKDWPHLPLQGFEPMTSSFIRSFTVPCLEGEIKLVDPINGMQETGRLIYFSKLNYSLYYYYFLLQ